jgi:hypothetical protein
MTRQNYHKEASSLSLSLGLLVVNGLPVGAVTLDLIRAYDYAPGSRGRLSGTHGREIPGRCRAVSLPLGANVASVRRVGGVSERLAGRRKPFLSYF